MCVAGMLDAMRSNLPLAQRLVWQCLENHANGHRFWSISISDLAHELNLNRETVIHSIRALDAHDIIRAQRTHRQTTTYFMLRSYPPDHKTPVLESEKPTLGGRKNRLKRQNLESEKPTQKAVLESEIPTQKAVLESEIPTVENPPRLYPPRGYPPRGTAQSPQQLTIDALDSTAEAITPPQQRRRPPDPIAQPQATLNVEAGMILAEWNASGLPKVRLMTPARRRKLAARLRDVGAADLVLAIRRLAASAFCRGENDRGWQADFDFLLRPDSANKALEGKYDRTAPKKPGRMDHLYRNLGMMDEAEPFADIVQ